MSMDVIRAILGEEVVSRLSQNEVAALAHQLDAEILKDPELTARLSGVVQTAAKRAQLKTSEPDQSGSTPT